MVIIMSKEVLKVKDLYFDYSDTSVLKNVNFTLYEGDFLGIIGSNGAGKSTLMKLILGTLPYYQGSISLFGTDIKKEIPRNLIGYVSQKAASFNSSFPATVKEVVMANLYSKKGLFKRYTKNDEEQFYCKSLDIRAKATAYGRAYCRHRFTIGCIRYGNYIGFKQARNDYNYVKP